MMVNNRVFIPLRAVSEALGAKVDWNGNEYTAEVALKSNDELVPEIIESVSYSVVGIIGNIKESYYSFNNKYQENIVHGTGVIISSDGQILTNAHVINSMENIVVVLSDGNGYEATIVCIDEESDLALIKIEKSGLKPATFAKSEDIVIGKTVIAIGTPISFSLRNSASMGIISGVNRNINSFYNLIQTDAAINPGNSGGPLVNLEGKVIGINSSKFIGNGIEGMGFSIPIDTVEYVLEHFEKYGKVIRPSLGVKFEEDWAARVGLPSNNGLKIIYAQNNSILKVDDILLSINDTKINSLVEFNEEMKKYKPQDKVKLKIKRNGIINNLDVVLQ